MYCDVTLCGRRSLVVTRFSEWITWIAGERHSGGRVDPFACIIFFLFVNVRVIIIATTIIAWVWQISSERCDERTEEDDCQEAWQDRRLNDCYPQVVSPPPRSSPNRTLFIAMNLQLPMSPKAAETSPRESPNRISCRIRQRRPLRRRKLRDGSVNVGKGLRRIQESCYICYINAIVWVAHHGPPSAVPRDWPWFWGPREQ